MNASSYSASLAQAPVDSKASAEIAVLERNRTVANRVGRLFHTLTGAAVAIDDDPASLRARLAERPCLLACEASEIELALGWVDTHYPTTRIVAWTQDDVAPLLHAADHPAIAAIVGWPPFASMPRPWELSQIAYKSVHHAHIPSLRDTLGWNSNVTQYVPRTSADRDSIVAEIGARATMFGANARLSEKASEVTHELLMNAMYDAPIDGQGHSLYAHDRKQTVSLAPEHAPIVQVGSDGMVFAIQVRDPFGRLDRRTLLRSIRRGRNAATAEGSVLDTSNGGAGLGLFRCYAAAQVMSVDVEPDRSTQVTAVFDLDIPPREARRIPTSLHLFL